jgi:hypothetical protein
MKESNPTQGGTRAVEGTGTHLGIGEKRRSLRELSLQTELGACLPTLVFSGSLNDQARLA